MEKVSLELVVTAFVAGLASFISPCVLPLVPAYIGYLGGHTTRAAAEEKGTSRFSVLMHGIFFVLGLALVFVALGVTAGAIGGFLQSDLVRYLGGTLIILFGLHIMGLYQKIYFRLSPQWQKRLMPIYALLYSDTRRQMQGREELGYLGSGLMGILFAGGWSPCLGPIVGSVLTLVASNDISPAAGGAVLFVYTMGLGVPFLIVAMALDRMTVVLRGLQRHMAKIEFISGALLVIMGVLVLSGTLQDLVKLDAETAEEDLTVDAVNWDAVAGPVATTARGDLTIGLEAGQLAPNFETQNMRGETLALEDFRDNKAVLVNFWATWCEPCREEMPDLQQAAIDHSDTLTVLMVNLEERPEVIVTFANRQGFNALEFVLDQQHKIHDLYNVVGQPTSYLIAADGTISAKQWGPITLEQLEAYLADMPATGDVQ